MVGQTISHYQILRKIGGGGMGVVFEAEDLSLGRRVALKFLPDELAGDPQALDRFRREARAASSLNHPNICVIHEIGDVDGHVFIVMELLEGETLKHRIQQGRLSNDELLDCGAQIANGLAAAHAKGIVHRDIKPANIFLTRSGPVKLLDFGIAKMTAREEAMAHAAETATAGDVHTSAGTTVGTLLYMSPEQALGKQVDGRSDLFSLGAVLYEAGTGVEPFRGETSHAVVDAIVHRQPTAPVRLNPDLSPNLEKVILRLLEKDPDLRYQSASDLRSELKRLKRDTDATVPLAPAARSKRLQTLVMAAILAVVVLAGLAWRYLRPGGSGESIEAIAVLPFTNAGTDPDSEYLSDGLTETLIDELGQLPHLRVMSRNSVLRYKGKEADAQTVGRELKVDAVLTGRLVQRGNDLSISAELVKVGDNSHLWGEEYNRKVADVLTIQQDITKDISEKLRRKLNGEDERRLAKRTTTNPEAYQLYLKGRYEVEKYTPEAMRKGIALFQQAIKLDPNYALAYAGISYAYWTGVDIVMPAREAVPPGMEAAKKALQLDEQLPEAHLDLAIAQFTYEYDWAAAEKELRRTIELNPNSAMAHCYYGWYLISIEKFDQGIAETKRALELEPYSLEVLFLAGQNYYFARRFDPAIEQLRRAVELEPRYWFAHSLLGLAYEAKGDYAHAIPEMEKGRELEPAVPWALSILAHGWAVSGRRNQAESALAELKGWSKRAYVLPYAFAEVYVGLGDHENALAALQRAYDERSVTITFLPTDPRFDSLRSDPRFKAILREARLPEQLMARVTTPIVSE